MSLSKVPIDRRVTCPCCGFPTLTEAAAYEICELCNWEDDGQGDGDAENVRGGPNGDYSLAEARLNFCQHLVMYRPDHDTRLTGPDSATERQAKRELITAFEQLRVTSDSATRARITVAVQRLEAVLEAELYRRLREYEDKDRAGGAA
jgi:hypothetical protein